MEALTIADRLEHAEKAFNEGRIIQGAWRRRDDGNGKGPGRELVCALAAFGPDINGSSDCPADLMPPWLAQLVPTLDDGIAADDVPWFFGELLSRAKQWHKLDSAAWERVRTGFLIMTIRDALASAEPVQPDPKPEYWQKVVDACEGVINALQGKGDLSVARAAAAAAAAEARWAAAAAEARWAAEAAAAAAARWAAEARCSTYRRIAEKLFDLIDVELR